MKGPVLTFALIAGFVGWWLGSTGGANTITQKDEQLNVRNERISFLNDQLIAYKDRLQGATPDEAAKKFSTLEKKLAEQDEELKLFFPSQARTLDDVTKRKLEDRLDRLKKDVKLLYIISFSLGDSPFYASSFYDFLKAKNIPVVGINMIPCDDSQRGVIVGIVNPDRPSPEATDFMNVLTEAGLRPTSTKWTAISGLGQDFDLFICPEKPIHPQAASAPTLPTPETK